MVKCCSKVVAIQASSPKMTRRERFEENIRKFYESGVSREMLCLAMGISKEELLDIVKTASAAVYF